MGHDRAPRRLHGADPLHAPLHAVVGNEAATVNGELYATIVALVLLFCWGLTRRDHASWGPDGEEPSRVRPGESPTEAPVVSGGAHLRLEQAPACDRAPDLSQDTDSTNVLLAGRSPVVVRSTAAGAPAVIYQWKRPEEGKRLVELGWELEHIDPRYSTWLVRKEERWP